MARPKNASRGDADARGGRLIWNDLWGEYGALAPARMQRREQTGDCPFCADLTSGRVPADAQAWIRPNDFPALTPPDGECVILIYSREHERRFADLSPDETLLVVGLWREVYDRYAAHYPCVMTWETSGEVIGQTQRHPHGQTYALSVLPDMLRREMEAVTRAGRAEEGCLFCAAIAEEEAGPRLIYAGEWWVAFVPAWARYPYQAQVVPRAHFSAMDGLAVDGPAARELAAFLPRLVRAYDRVFRGEMPYMLALHQLTDARFHFHVELLPVGRAPGKLKLAASSEMAFGFWLNDALPEEKAAELRALLAEDTLRGSAT